jgi:hypothetical protein
MRLTVNVAGEVVQVQADPTRPLWNVMNQAFAAAGRLGEPWENWELRDSTGRFLDRKVVLSEFGLHPGVTLFLNMKAGIGG